MAKPRVGRWRDARLCGTGQGGEIDQSLSLRLVEGEDGERDAHSDVLGTGQHRRHQVL